MLIRFICIGTCLMLIMSCQKSIAIKPEVRAAHDQMYVFDLHVDTPMVVKFMNYDIGEEHRGPQWFFPWMLHTDLPRMQEGGLNGMQFGIVVNPKSKDPQASVERQIKFITEEIAGRYPDKITLARTTRDFDQAYADGKMAFWMALEGAHELGGSLEKLEEWYGKGVRSIGLAHFTSNEFAASSADTNPDHPGLSAMGRRLICEANRLGIVLDLAHTHPVSFYEALKLTKAPVIVSHTGASAQLDVFRNLSNHQIEAVARNGGVIGAMFAGFWINQKRWASMQDLVNLINIIRDHGGVDALAIGSDFDGFIWTPRGIKDVSDLPVLTQALLNEGYTDEDLKKMWGDNVMRVFREVEAVSRSLQKEGYTCRL